MKLRISATHPTTRTDGSAFNPATDLSRWRVRKSISGGYEAGPDLPHSQTTYDIPNVTVGQEMTVIVDWFDQDDQLNVKVLTVVVQPPASTLPAPPSPGDATYVTLND